MVIMEPSGLVYYSSGPMSAKISPPMKGTADEIAQRFVDMWRTHIDNPRTGAA